MAYTVNIYNIDIVYTIDMVYTVDNVYTVDMVYNVDTVDTVYTVYIIQTVLLCFHISMYAFIYCQERLERYWNGLLLNEQKVGEDGGVTGVDTPF